MATHVIRKQVLDLKIGSSAAAFHLQQQAGEYYQQQVLPALEKIFDELCYPDETIQMDTLEIDLGILEEKELGLIAAGDAIYQLLKKQIVEQLKKTGPSKKLTRQSINTTVAQQWLFYMRYGYLNWNTGEINEQWYHTVLETLATDYMIVADVRKLVKENHNGLQRIVAGHTVSFLINLVRILTAKKLPQLEAVAEELTSILFYWFNDLREVKKNNKEITWLVWKNIVQLSAEESAKNRADEIFIEIIIGKIITPGMAAAMLHGLKPKLIQINPVIKNVIEAMAEEHLKRDQTAVEESKMQGINNNTEQLPEEMNATENIEGESLFVNHAGLLLLHPLLATFYKRLGLVESGSFKNIAAQQKAILLLHYLATGNTAAEEYELVMPKLICNWPLHQAVAFSDDIAAEELDEADNLLQSVIEKWEKLKNTSAAALQENFLQRNGKITMKNEAIIIQVEMDSLDILLEFLPWGINIIKLPWRKEMIRVEWR